MSVEIHQGVSGILSELKWPLYGSCFWDMVQKLKGISDPEVTEGDSDTLQSALYFSIYTLLLTNRLQCHQRSTSLDQRG